MNRPTHFLHERGGRDIIYLFLVCIFSFHVGHGQSYSSSGAASNALAGAVCAITDEVHTLQSVASSAFAKQASLSSHYKNHYLLRGVQSSAALGLLPYKTWIVGIAGEKMGASHFYEIKTSISIAHRIQHTALGLRAHWQELYAEGFNTQHAFVFEFGGLTKLSEHLTFGGSIYNFTLSKFEHRVLPVVLRCGLSGKAHTKLLLTVEAEKNSYDPLAIKAGASYEVHTRVKFAVGYSHPAMRMHAGFTVSYHNISLSYNLAWHIRMGISQDFSLVYALKKKTR
jgi:hypothetical protein